MLAYAQRTVERVSVRVGVRGTYARATTAAKRATPTYTVRTEGPESAEFRTTSLGVPELITRTNLHISDIQVNFLNLMATFSLQ